MTNQQIADFLKVCQAQRTPEQLVPLFRKYVASLGYVIIRNPAHAPEAVEAAAKVNWEFNDFSKNVEYSELDDGDKAELANEATAALAAYIERAGDMFEDKL